MTTTAEKHEFKAEVNQILSLVVNSLYTNSEVFLRELISNASDALDHLSFRSLTEPDLLGDQKELRIDVIPDREARTLTVRDTGVGMTRDELIENLGTIARSGTRELVQRIEQAKEQGDVSLIGQFGVGFYSAFLVADRVEVVTRAAGSEEAYRWVSSADGEFTVEPAGRDERGTDVILHLKEDEDDYLREWTLREVVRKYSDYVRHPIRLEVERQRPVEGAEDEDETETVTEYERVNQAGALWTRPRSELSEEQYHEFYKHLTHDWMEPLAYEHFRVEGIQQLTGLLFLPRKAPFDLASRKQRGVRLFVRRVFIMDECEELVPEWLRFLRGLIDSEDLPLNVSREFLQQDRTTKAIRKQVVRKTLDMLESLADEGEVTKELPDDADEGAEPEVTNRYLDFWREFGPVLKEGIHFEPEHRDRIAELLRYESTHGEGLTSLAEYLHRMPEDQQAIYYVTAESRAAAQASPHIEGLRKKGYEVLLMTDPVDEWVVQALTEYHEKKLVSAAKGVLDLPEDEEEKKEREERAGQFTALFDRLKSALSAHVKEVRLTDRLTDSPACLVADEGGLSPHIERMLRANNQALPETKRILELNPDHAAVQKLRELADAGESEQVEEWSTLLYDQALVAEGSPPSDPARLAKQIASLMSRL